MKTPANPSLFLPTGARVAAILQLCIAFSTLLWLLLSPFTYDLYLHKVKMAPLRFLLDDKAQFSELTLSDQTWLINLHEAQVKEGQKDGVGKTLKALKSLFFEKEPLFLTWLCLSLILPIMLLKRVEGARQAFWLLPLLLGCLYVYHIKEGSQKTATAFERLVPEEQELAKTYLDRPIVGSLNEQMDLLKTAFEKYLIANYGKDLNEAQYKFQFQLLKEQVKDGSFEKKPNHTSPALLAAGFLFSLLLGYIVNKSLKLKQKIDGDAGQIAR